MSESCSRDTLESAMTVRSQRKIEMQWRCSACGHTNLGRFKECQRCGDPKDKSEKFEMPSDTAAAPTVTDPALLAKAHGGVDWRCHYCGYDNWRGAAFCGQCRAAREEGKSVREEGVAPVKSQAVPVPPPGSNAEAYARMQAARAAAGVAAAPVASGAIERRAAPAGLVGLKATIAVLAGLLGTVVIGMFALVVYYVVAEPWKHDAHVESVAWHHELDVERWTVVQHEGFAESRTPDVFDVVSLGSRHHHDEQVFDHMGSEDYQEQVQDGYDTETYTEQVSCGEDCTTTPETCSESCESDDNGFATCSTTCSGGGQSCTTRYCSETRTRQMPRMTWVTKTRAVPVYRAEPRYAEAYAWKRWEWAAERTVVLDGSTSATRWPAESELTPVRPLLEGERLRAAGRRWLYTLRWHDDEQPGRFETHPQNERAFAAYPIGTRRELDMSAAGQPRVIEPAR